MLGGISQSVRFGVCGYAEFCGILRARERQLAPEEVILVHGWLSAAQECHRPVGRDVGLVVEAAALPTVAVAIAVALVAAYYKNTAENSQLVCLARCERT